MALVRLLMALENQCKNSPKSHPTRAMHRREEKLHFSSNLRKNKKDRKSYYKKWRSKRRIFWKRLNY